MLDTTNIADYTVVASLCFTVGTEIKYCMDLKPLELTLGEENDCEVFADPLM